MQTKSLPSISFFYNWNNKLHCKAFTTLRLHNPNKYQVGQQYQIVLNKKPLGTGTVRQIKNLTLATLNEFIAQIDTGYSLEKCREIIQTMYKNSAINWDVQLISLILITYDKATETKI